MSFLEFINYNTKSARKNSEQLWNVFCISSVSDANISFTWQYLFRCGLRMWHFVEKIPSGLIMRRREFPFPSTRMIICLVDLFRADDVGHHQKFYFTVSMAYPFAYWDTRDQYYVSLQYWPKEEILFRRGSSSRNFTALWFTFNLGNLAMNGMKMKKLVMSVLLWHL
jgi:hypothetical protein